MVSTSTKKRSSSNRKGGAAIELAELAAPALLLAASKLYSDATKKGKKGGRSNRRGGEGLETKPVTDVSTAAPATTAAYATIPQAATTGEPAVSEYEEVERPVVLKCYQYEEEQQGGKKKKKGGNPLAALQDMMLKQDGGKKKKRGGSMCQPGAPLDLVQAMNTPQQGGKAGSKKRRGGDAGADLIEARITGGSGLETFQEVASDVALNPNTVPVEGENVSMASVVAESDPSTLVGGKKPRRKADGNKKPRRKVKGGNADLAEAFGGEQAAPLVGGKPRRKARGGNAELSGDVSGEVPEAGASIEEAFQAKLTGGKPSKKALKKLYEKQLASLKKQLGGLAKN